MSGDISQGLQTSNFVCAQWQDTSVMDYTYHILHVLIILATSFVVYELQTRQYSSVIACLNGTCAYGLRRLQKSRDIVHGMHTSNMVCAHQHGDIIHGLHASANVEHIVHGLHTLGVACVYMKNDGCQCQDTSSKACMHQT